jgi:hypothetical protein
MQEVEGSIPFGSTSSFFGSGVFSRGDEARECGFDDVRHAVIALMTLASRDSEQRHSILRNARTRALVIGDESVSERCVCGFA